jgi:type IV pilus assembly protein PilB
MKGPLISRIKIMSELDIAEKRLPQDGRFKVRVGDSGKMVDFRVSTVPCVWGEKIVMRTIDDSNLQVDMTKLGFEKSDLKLFLAGIQRPKGMILITGPTGSGKTQTLYSSLLELNTEHVNISTAEDPVEYNLEGINQVWVKEDIGLSFAACLRSFLRQDPDIIMIGEVRDQETAEIAIKASLTGHLVFSTLHTNDAPSTINRIVDMGVPAYNLMPALNLIVAQRLARKICVKCREETDFVPAELIKLGVPPGEITGLKAYKGRGCSYCSRTGYKGRIGIFEVLPITSDITEAVLRGASAAELGKEAIRLGMSTLRQDALKKFTSGVIDIDEVVRITSGD